MIDGELIALFPKGGNQKADSLHAVIFHNILGYIQALGDFLLG